VILTGNALDVLKTLPPDSVQTCVTSPPYWGLRDYGVSGQLGLESTPDEYVSSMVDVFREVRRVLHKDGTLWLNLGDSYAGGGSGSRDQERWPKQSRNDHMATHAKKQHGLKTKDLVGIPWRVAFALQADGWYLRQDIIWHKPNPMPESVRDRCTKAHEYIFLLAKSEKYFFDVDAIKEPAKFPSGPNNIRPADEPPGSRPGFNANIYGQLHKIGPREKRNKRTVWTVTTKPFKGAHFATFPPDLIEPCILAGSRVGDMVLDPFFGAGTTGLVAQKHGRKWIGVELNPAYVTIAEERLGMNQLTLEPA
jgi:DNA modification methylase